MNNTVPLDKSDAKYDDNLLNDAEDADVSNMLASLRLPGRDAQKSMMDQADIADQLHKLNTKRTAVRDCAVMELPDAFKPAIGPQDSWTYLSLTRCESIQTMIKIMLSACRLKQIELGARAVDVEWCFAFDNSGSMVRIADACAEAMVVLTEVMRRLEMPFAIAALGDKSRARVLKRLDQPFTLEAGERILAGLTYTEGSDIASGARAVADTLFGAKKQRKRAMILVTDCMFRELSSDNFADVRRRVDYLAVVNTALDSKADLHDVLRSITDGRFAIVLQSAIRLSKGDVKLGKNEFRGISAAFAHLIGDIMSALEAPESKSITDTSHVPIQDSAEFFPIDETFKSNDIYTAISVGGSPPHMMYTASCLTHENPAATSLKRSTAQKPIENVDKLLELAITNCTSLSQHASVPLAAGKWRSAADKLAREVEDLADVLDEVVIPNNRFTRRRADFKGSQLHLQGLIKAVITDFTYKRFFSSRTAGGKRSYWVVLALDISQSMEGHLLHASIASLLMFIEAFKRLDFSGFSVVTFGGVVEVVKGWSQEWDDTCVLSLLRRVVPQHHNTTRDADSIRLCTALLDGLNGEKKIFVLTDGFGSCGDDVHRAIGEAGEAGVQVVGCGVGMDRTNVRAVYAQYITAALPRALPSALRTLFDRDRTDVTATDPEDEWLAKMVVSFGQDEFSKKKVLDARWERFEKAQEMLSQDRQAKLKQGNMPGELGVDLGFVIDCTGSMAPVLNMVKSQIRGIISGDSSVCQQIEKSKGVKIKLRCAVLGFRDRKDNMQFVEFAPSEGAFSEAIDETERRIKSLNAEGGGDLCEDVPDAVKKAMQWRDWKSHAKFIVLVTDAPCHGSEFSNGIADDFPDDSARSSQTWSECFRMGIRNNINILHCTCNPQATQVMHAKMVKLLKDVHATLDVGPDQVVRDVEVDGAPYLAEARMVEQSGGGPSQTPAIHIVFVLDESGSMSGSPFEEVRRAYRAFLTLRTQNQGVQDLVSVVQFDSSARVVMQAKPISQALIELPFKGEQGKSFVPAIQMAQQCIDSTPSHSSNIVFMTDGQANDSSEAEKVLAALYQKSRAAGNPLKVHAIGIGSGANQSSIDGLARAAGSDGQTYMRSFDQLVSTFAEIAKGSSASDKLFSQIGQRISECVEHKLALDFL